jgi:hypothetical protein
MKETDMPDQPNDLTLDALVTALAGRPVAPGDRERLLAVARQVREDGRVLLALDLGGIEPEPRPPVDPPDEERRP